MVRSGFEVGKEEVADMHKSLKLALWLVGIPLVVLGIFEVNGSFHYEVSALWLNDEAPFNVSYVGGYLAAFVGVLMCGAAFMTALSDWYQKK
jgi:hypothetical protein